jgi:hypothetical protein
MPTASSNTTTYSFEGRAYSPFYLRRTFGGFFAYIRESRVGYEWEGSFLGIVFAIHDADIRN